MKPSQKREENLYVEVQAAKKQLDAAQALEMELIRRTGRNRASSDGFVTLAEARLIHADARLRYRRLLASFSSLVVGSDRVGIVSGSIKGKLNTVRQSS